MNPIDIAGHLDERFRLLTGKRRGRIERHQTLRANSRVVHQLLDDEERMVFDRLGTFAGSFDEAAAIVVAGGADELYVLTVTDAVPGEPGREVDARHRDRPGRRNPLHDARTLRQYAVEELRT